jgi:hypothetical protein
LSGLNIDLNQGAGGSYLYLCAVSSDYAPSNILVPWTNLYSSDTENCADGSNSCVPMCYPIETYLGSSTTTIADLNDGAGTAMHLCQGLQSVSSGYGLTHLALGTSGSSLASAKNNCYYALNTNAGVTGTISYAQADTGGTSDLNDGAGGDYIALCTGAGPLTVTSCPTDATSWRGENGAQHSCQCSASRLASPGAVTGTVSAPDPRAPGLPPLALYTDGSDMCAAALHRGAVTSAGGIVTVTNYSAAANFVGSTAHGITSLSRSSSYPGTIHFQG